MKHRVVILAVASALAWSAVPAGAGQPHHGKEAAARKEQKPWGTAGEAKAVNRTIQIVMTDDMRFSPDLVEVKQGETVRFVLRNAGKLLHEMIIGTRRTLDEHASQMARSPGIEHHEASMVHVAAGKTGELVWRFNRAGEFDFACLIPGHYQAGMVGKIKVAAAPGADAHGRHPKH